MNSKYEQLTSQLKQLKFKIKDDELYDFLKDIDGKKASIVDGLLALTEKEIDARTQSREMVNIHVASFPFTKSIDDYNFGFSLQLMSHKFEVFVLAALLIIMKM